jgi:hypothetical protein
MKYLKYFEKTELKYWTVSTKNPNLEISLEMIGVNKKGKELVEFIKDIRRDAYFSSVKFMSIMSFGDIDHTIWSATAYECENKYKFQGEIIINPEDIEKWKIKKETDKYNL